MSLGLRVSRRSFLASLGVGVPAVALPVLRASPLQAALAPTRLLVFFTPNGTIPESWLPARDGTGGFSFAPGSILEPLADFRPKLTILRGVGYIAGRRGPGSNHQKGAGLCLVARPMLAGTMAGGGGTSAGYAGGISVDQHIANRLGNVTRFRSLELGVNIFGAGNRQRLAYLGANQPLPVESDPTKVFARVFGSFGGANKEEAAKVLAERKSILDHVREDLGILMRRLPGDEKARLQRHLDSLRDVERQLTAPAATGAACLPPAQGTRIDPRATANYPMVGRLQMDLAATALACDQTRLMTFMWNGSTSQQTFPWLGVSGQHHTLSHEPDSNTAVRESLIKVNRYYATELAYLLAKLDAIKEANGQSVLDNSLVVWTNELGKGNSHTLDNIPWVLAGSAGGYVRTGRLLEYRNESHSNLLVSFMHAMGLRDEKTFGEPEFCTGPLRDLAA